MPIVLRSNLVRHFAKCLAQNPSTQKMCSKKVKTIDPDMRLGQTVIVGFFMRDKMKKIISGLIAATILAGCSEQAPITTPPVDVTREAGFQTAGIQDFQPITIRATGKVGGKSASTEISGANCELSGSGYSAKFITPAVVRVPNYGRTGRAVTVFCRSQNLSGLETANVFNRDLSARRASVANSGNGNGILGALIAGGIAASMKEREGDRFGYGDQFTIRLK